MRKLRIAVALAVLSTGMLTPVQPTLASGHCTPTGFVRDSINLTAKLINPASVTTNVDASGCHIGVFVDNGTTTITNVTIENATYFGIVARTASAALTVTDTVVQTIGESPFNGAQHGVGIYVSDGASATIDSTTIQSFQKNGTAFTGAGTTADITNSTILGEGQIDYIAQNGIQYSSGASGTARGNLIADIWWTGCSHKDAAKTGCTPWVASGILLFDVDPGQVSTSMNHFRNVQFNYYMYP